MELLGGKFWPLRILWCNLHMFLEIFKIGVTNKTKIYRENCFNNVVSEIHKKNLFCPQNKTKTDIYDWMKKKEVFMGEREGGCGEWIKKSPILFIRILP